MRRHLGLSAKVFENNMAHALIALGLAYPVSGLLFGTLQLVEGIYSGTVNSSNLGLGVALMFWFMVLVPVSGGFPSVGGPGENMYPWIIPTAIVIFFVFRWYRMRPKN